MIYLGADHGGFDAKEKIKKWLTEWGQAYEDLGNTVYDKDDDYPKFAYLVAAKVGKEEEAGNVYPKVWKDRPKGLLLCRSAAGMAIAANKVRGARAVVAFSPDYAKQSRLHNDANILGLAGDWLEDYQVKKILQTWLETEFTGEDRHVRRLSQIREIEAVK
jgi:RpiB/LacA/LacB family sugar-phosphate isomerase